MKKKSILLWTGVRGSSDTFSADTVFVTLHSWWFWRSFVVLLTLSREMIRKKKHCSIVRQSLIDQLWVKFFEHLVSNSLLAGSWHLRRETVPGFGSCRNGVFEKVSPACSNRQSRATAIFFDRLWPMIPEYVRPELSHAAKNTLRFKNTLSTAKNFVICSRPCKVKYKIICSILMKFRNPSNILALVSAISAWVQSAARTPPILISGESACRRQIRPQYNHAILRKADTAVV